MGNSNSHYVLLVFRDRYIRVQCFLCDNCTLSKLLVRDTLHTYTANGFQQHDLLANNDSANQNLC